MLHYVQIQFCCCSRRILLHSFCEGYRSFRMSTEIASSPGSRWFKAWGHQKWYPTSHSRLELAEKRILSYYKTPFKIEDVNIGAVVGSEDCKIRTLSMNENSLKTPIVLLHGLGQGVGNWVLNLDAIAAERPVYAIDTPGFSRSSRPAFSKDALEAEMEMVDCIEAWRKEMKLERMILLGFSMGGFLATSYAFQYPQRLSHLILAEPWGFPTKSSDMSILDIKTPIAVPHIIGALLYPLSNRFYPYFWLRLTAKLQFGNKIIRTAFPMLENFSLLGEDGVDAMLDYMVSSNSQEANTGETTLVTMSSAAGLLWAKFPMIERIPTSLDEDVPLTLINGTKSWLFKTPGSEIQKLRPNSYVNELLIEGSDHDCNVWESSIFNDMVIKACEFGDQNFNR